VTKPPLMKGRPDDFQTPPEALFPLIPFLKPHATIWEPAAGNGNLVRELKRRKFHVIGSDIKTGQDFLTWSPMIYYDYIITNPPYSLKQKFLERCYELRKPFALLLPLTTFETRKRQMLFLKYGIQVIFFDKRINFETPSGRNSGAWFATAWFTNGLNLPKDLLFTWCLNPDQNNLKDWEYL